MIALHASPNGVDGMIGCAFHRCGKCIRGIYSIAYVYTMSAKANTTEMFSFAFHEPQSQTTFIHIFCHFLLSLCQTRQLSARNVALKVQRNWIPLSNTRAKCLKSLVCNHIMFTLFMRGRLLNTHTHQQAIPVLTAVFAGCVSKYIIARQKTREESNFCGQGVVVWYWLSSRICKVSTKQWSAKLVRLAKN